MDATASRPPDQGYSKLHFIPEFAEDNKTISFNKVHWKEGEPVIVKEPHVIHFQGLNIEKTGIWKADGAL